MPVSAAPCRVVSIFSTKGGVGKTLIAANLAVSFYQLLGTRTAILSVDASHDDTAGLLGESSVQRVTDPVTAQSLPGLIERLRRSCAYLVIDAGSVLSDAAVAALERSNLILLVTTPDVVALQHTTRMIDALASLQFPLRMIKVVINRAESHGNVRSRDLREQLSVEVIAEIPSDGRTVGLSVNQRIPFMASDNGTRLHESFKRFVRTLIDSPSLFAAPFQADPARLAAMLPQAQASVARAPEGALSSAPKAADDPIIALKRAIHAKLIERFDLKRMDLKTLNDPLKFKQLKEQTERVAVDLLSEEGGFITSRQERARLVKELIDDALGLGPLEDLIADQDVSDILVNGKDRVYVEKHGKLFLTDKRFVSNDQVLTVIERIIAPLGRRIDESTPMVDARLPDGSRVNAIINPLSLKGPALSIRKFNRERLTIQDLIRLNTLSASMAEFLSMCVKARKNMIVSGGTGSGKTTILNALSAFVPEGERIVTIEDAAELRLSQEHWLPLESRQSNIEGRGAITIRQLFRNTLRMRPDRIIIGECRGDETLDMLQAMNTGHDGSLTTLHANSPQDVIARLDSLVLMSNVDLPVRAIREQIASAIHVIVHTSRMQDGTRKMTHITELTGMNDQADILMSDIFRFTQQGLGPKGEVLGEFQPTGYAPSFLADLKAKGFAIDESLFRP